MYQLAHRSVSCIHISKFFPMPKLCDMGIEFGIGWDTIYHSQRFATGGDKLVFCVLRLNKQIGGMKGMR